MKKWISIPLLVSALCNAQSFQWGIRGGSATPQPGTDAEQVYGITTDSERNVYAVANSLPGSDIAGVPIPNYAGPNNMLDVVLFSLSCEGNYRWSKVFGGGGKEYVHPPVTDAEGNVYVAGRFSSCGGVGEYPARIGTDTIFDQSSDACSLLFFAKFDSEGEMVWLKRPQPSVDGSTASGHTGSFGFIGNGDGSFDWLVYLPPGSYENGAFVSSLEDDSTFVLHYDADGTFTGATHLDIHSDGGATLAFYKNPYNGHYFITGLSLDQNALRIGGTYVDNTFYLSSFDQNGQFLWTRENTNTTYSGLDPYGLAFNEQGNIFLAGRMAGFSLDSFLGYSIAEALLPAFVMKLSPTADSIVWVTQGNRNAESVGGAYQNGNVFALTTYSNGTLVWGDQTEVVSAPGTGSRPLLATFDLNTGNCLDLGHIDGPEGVVDFGACVTADANGDYLVGGNFMVSQTYGNGTVTSAGGNTDFFIGKYAMAPCADLSAEAPEPPQVGLWPNPVRDRLHLSGISQGDFRIYDLRGVLAQQGAFLDAIDVTGLPAGLYLLRLKDDASTWRFVKQ